MEDKHDKWVRLSKNRKNKIKEQLRLIVNLSNKSNYDFSEEEADKLFDSIEEAVRDARNFYKGYKRFTFEKDKENN